MHVIYRRIDDEFLDPVQFRADSALGVPGIINAARAGHVTIANAVGNGVADDKLLYTYVPDLIRYYLSEEPILRNVDTWRLGEADQREEVLDRLDELVLKPVDGSGGKGIVIGPAASKAELDELRGKILLDPRAWIAQPVVSLSTVPTLVEDGIRPRHVDLRPFAVHDGDDVLVLPGGLTRVALPEGELIVNSSRGGGSKDTWVLARPDRSRRRRGRGRSHRPRRLVVGHQPVGRPGARQRPPASVQVQEQEQQQGRDRAARGRAGMLSRIAQSLFWIGRYLERADDTARILDVQMQVLIEDPGMDERTSCEQLLSVMGVEDYTGHPNRWMMLDLLAHNPDSPTSIAAAIGAARESCAPGPRDAVDRHLGRDQHDLARAQHGPRDASAGHVQLGPQPHRDDLRHRRLHDVARRRLALLHAGPQHRAGRHDRPAAVDRGAGLRPAGRLADDAARLRRVRELHPRLPRHRGRSAGRGVPAARPLVPRARSCRRWPRPSGR